MKLLTNSEKFKSLLEEINIHDSFDLIENLPYRYDDYSYSDEDNINDGDKLTLLIRLVSNPQLINTKKMKIIKFYFISLKSNKFYNAIIYNQGFYQNVLNLNDEFTLRGSFSKKNNAINVNKITKGEILDAEKLKPVYHISSNISPSLYLRLVKKTLDNIAPYYFYDVPKMFQNKYRLLSRIDALKKVHFPSSNDDIKVAFRTLKYNECLEFCLKNEIIKNDNNVPVEGKHHLDDLKKINTLISSLNYKLTSDQIKAIREIVLDMNKNTLMYRLLEGDVGTGKTIVAICALYANYLRHNVGAFMVPMDALAKQQYEELVEILSPFNVRIGLLVGSMSIKEKKEIKDKLLNNEIDIMVGTHALFSDDVNYPSLGLCVIDEQHRFGVNQRSKLISKGSLCDLLLMSATPIPRTLSIALYGDLDVSTLNMYPFKKNRVLTKVVSFDDNEIINFIDKALQDNRQVFILAPMIEDNDNAYSVEKLFNFYHKIYDDNVICLTGKMKAKEKDQILDDFKNKKNLILVSTTVVELGLNVLDAELIIIYSASNFGLATLHQLRGRVGRNGKDAKCLLVDDKNIQKLSILENVYDGANLAVEDLKMRGGGDFIGQRQSGFSTFQCVNVIDDNKMLLCAKEDASYIINHLDDKDLHNYYLKIKDRMHKDEQIILMEN